MNRRVFAFAAVAVMHVAGLTLSTRLGAQEGTTTYKIVVDMDETSIGDLRILENTFSKSTDGEEVSKAVRKVTMGAMGEAWAELHNRVDGFGSLTLDDGASANLLENDVIEVQGKGTKFQPGATITFQRICDKLTGKCHNVPVRIIVVRGDGSMACSDFPPKHLGTFFKDELRPECSIGEKPPEEK